ncbi:TPR domain protein [Cystobacter fuscus DSM 2262]|uniref:TPR domain protein n=1 Tax=Cystobacter fuscus (strain ATCC 25194 / DSM 2262 / NBRC 100088 / M29) TaxID=1242864 RepID=S9NXE4_CYSF2|nr:hypothetical protein [Cystobacter fuscus]EPX55541.1 TPR domain protein [Cystobacter fuscus DSM 2262]
MAARAVSPFHRTPPEVVLPELEVSVVLLEEEETPSYGTASLPSITADVLAFLSEGDMAQEEEAPPEPPARKGPGVNTLLVGVDELLSLGDVSSALELLEKAEQLDPLESRLEGARARCEQAQRAALEQRLGSVKQVPRLKLRMAELMKLSLDARMGFLLSRIDGHLNYEALFSVSGMSRMETMRVLVQLLDQDIITLAPR